MITQKNIALTLLISTSILATTLLFAVSCKNKENPEDQVKVETPGIDIHTAVMLDSLEAVKQHIAAGTNLNEKDPFGGSSPLITAALFNKQEMAKILIDAGADINFKNKEGSTPLHTASFFCRPGIVKMLLDKGADKTIRNKYHDTPYESIKAPFSVVKPIYDRMGKMLEPMGLKMDYAYIEKTRPAIAAMLK